MQLHTFTNFSLLSVLFDIARYKIGLMYSFICDFFTRLLSMKSGRSKGSKTKEEGVMSTGLCRLPSLHNFQSGFKRPQKSTPGISKEEGHKKS